MGRGEDGRFHERLQRVEGLLQQVERFADPEAREVVRELVRTLLDLHGAGLEVMLGLARDAGPAGQEVLDACAGNDLVSSLLLLHGLHPIDLPTRVSRALEQVSPTLTSQGARAELVGLSEGVVRVRLTGEDRGEGGSLKLALEEALLRAAPDAAGVEVEDARVAAPSRLVPLPLVGGSGS